MYILRFKNGDTLAEHDSISTASADRSMTANRMAKLTSTSKASQLNKLEIVMKPIKLNGFG